MKLKRLPLILLTLILVLSLIFVSGCFFSDIVKKTTGYILSASIKMVHTLYSKAAEVIDASKEDEKAMDGVIIPAEEEINVEQEREEGLLFIEEAELPEGLEEEEDEKAMEEEEKLLPNEPITYHCTHGAISISIVINFETGNVTGEMVSRTSDTKEIVLYGEIVGEINIETFEVSAVSNGYINENSHNETITGVVTNDLETFNGFRDWEEAAVPASITAPRKY